MKHLLSLYQDLQFVNCRVRHFLPFFLGDVYILRAASLSWSVCARWTDILRDFCRRRGVRGWKQDDLGVPWYVRVSKTWNWTAIYAQKHTWSHISLSLSLSLYIYIYRKNIPGTANNHDESQAFSWEIAVFTKHLVFRSPASKKFTHCRVLKGGSRCSRGRGCSWGKPKDSRLGGLGNLRED